MPLSDVFLLVVPYATLAATVGAATWGVSVVLRMFTAMVDTEIDL